MQPELASAGLPALVWRLPAPMLVVSSAPVGGGIGLRSWIVNAQVPLAYGRRDLDAHVAELAAALGLGAGLGVGMLTATAVERFRSVDDGGVTAVATVGLTHPVWAAAPDAGDAEAVGTINVVGFLPVRLADAALVNAVATVAEAKAQALLDAGVAATGTASDATTLACPADGPSDAFGGPRSTWGARLARAVHAAVRAGAGS